MKSKHDNEILNSVNDSLSHALTHFEELAVNAADSTHHQKWIILSVHHAAETYLYMLLSAVDPTNKILNVVGTNGKPWFPSSTKLLGELKKLNAKLIQSEVKLLSVLDELINLRNNLMHTQKSI